MSTSLLDEIKAEYVKVIKKLQVDGIVKPIPNPDKQFPEKQQEKSLTIAQVFLLIFKKKFFLLINSTRTCSYELQVRFFNFAV